MKNLKLIVATVLVCSWSVGFSGTIRGTAYDPDGRVVPDARVLLMMDYVKQSEQQTGQSGEFRFDGIKPGRYELQIKKGRMFIFQNTVILEKPDQDFVVFAVLPIARMIEVSGVSATLPSGVTKKTPATTGAPAQGGVVQLAERLRPARVPYPPEAAAQGIEGTVAIHARINVDGTVSDVLVLSSPHELLTKAAVESFSGTVYKPMRLNDHPVPCGIDVQIEFKLNAPGGPQATAQ